MSLNRIVFIGDQPGKVHFRRYQAFCKHISDISFDYLVASEKHLNKRCRRYDAVYYASIALYDRRPVKHKRIFGSATSWKCVNDKRSRRILKKLDRFHGVSANNLALAEVLREYRKDIQYLPNGVDIDYFCPSEFEYNPDKITIGWVGNKDRDEKNYRRLLVRIKKTVGPPFRIKTITSKKSTPAKRLVSPKRMRRFYRKLSYYLVTSSYEGTPNPALEAAACGVPVITTRVGNMPELIVHRENGFFIKKDVKRANRRIRKLSLITNDQYYEMRKKIRTVIINEWSWEKAAKGFGQFFNAS